MALIAVSGVDGSGKSTQIELLAQSLSHRSLPTTVRWFRPGYSPQALWLKKKLAIPTAAGRAGSATSELAERRDSAMGRPAVRFAWILFAVADTIFETALVARYLGLRGTVVYDRWVFDATLDLKNNFPEFRRTTAVAAAIYAALAKKPDCALCLTVSSEVAAKRLADKDEPFPDSVSVAESRRHAYQLYLDSNPDQEIDTDPSIEEVHLSVIERVNQRAGLGLQSAWGNCVC